jgi:ribosome-binding factor A
MEPVMNYKRSDRVGDLVKEEIASMIQRGEIKDPRIGFVTITGASMSRDLRQVKVFFSILGTSEDKERNRAGLNSASGYIRRALAKRLKLKQIPTIVFEFDESLEYSSHIDKVIKDLKEESG